MSDFVKNWTEVIKSLPMAQRFDADEARQIIAAWNDPAALRARLAELEPDQGWRPIETAPEGEWIQCYAFGYAQWVGFKRDGKWIEYLPIPTHWMPLPEPPK